LKSNLTDIQTKAVHAGEIAPVLGAVTLPVFQSATYLYGGEKSYHDVHYIRLNNTPNHEVLGRKLAALENAEAAMVASSGMAAISTALLTVLSAGDHLLAIDALYGGTHDFVVGDLPSFGVEVTLVDPAKPETWAAQLKPRTRAFYVETITNPLVRVPALKEAVAFARERGLVSMIDNTFASPVNFRPAEWGFDLSLHSCTKYLNGHSDIVAGAFIGKAELVGRVTKRLNHLGGSLDPHACFLLHRGIKTLALRVRHQNESALRIAQFLAGHAAVESVHYPGLPTHPDRARAAELLDGFSGMLAFELKGGAEAAERFLSRLTIPYVAPSLGGVESLITRPVTTSHAGLTPEARAKAGITDGLIRFSTGIEATEELIEDFERAMG
jgi:cystathionine beta-lyase/cystathionine gamma-synthase